MNNYNSAVTDYIASLNKTLEIPDLDELYGNSVMKKIPVIRKDTAKLLYMLVKIMNPENILEIGTGSGYSTLWIYKASAGKARLTTIERDKNRYLEAGNLFRNYPGIELIFADAFKFLNNSREIFDFVFLDAQKRDYLEYLKVLENKIAQGGVFFIDNFLFNGKAIEIKPADEDKYRSGVELLKRFNSELASNKNFESIFLQVDDGVIITRKK